MKIGIKLSLVNAIVVIVIMAISITFLTMRDVRHRNNEVLKLCRMIAKELKLTREYLAESLAAFGDITLDEKMASFIPARAVWNRKEIYTGNRIYPEADEFETEKS